MTRLFCRLWADDSGALIATEWVFVATILVLGGVAALNRLNPTPVPWLVDFANAVSSLNQSYSFGGSSGCCGSAAGSAFTETSRRSFSFSGCVPAPTLAATGCP
jgi:hypothetical protein